MANASLIFAFLVALTLIWLTPTLTYGGEGNNPSTLWKVELKGEFSMVRIDESIWSNELRELVGFKVVALASDLINLAI